MEFITDILKRTELRSKAEEFARKLVRKHKEQVQRLILDGGCVNVDEMVSNSNNEDTDIRDIIDTPFQGPSARRKVEEKRDLSTFSCATTRHRKSKFHTTKFQSTIWYTWTIFLKLKKNFGRRLCGNEVLVWIEKPFRRRSSCFCQIFSFKWMSFFSSKAGRRR